MPAKIRRLISHLRQHEGDYVVQAGGLAGDDGFTSKAYLALKTKRGSCTVIPEFGSRLHEVKTADEAGARQAQGLAADAVAHLLAEVPDLTVTGTYVPAGNGNPTHVIRLDVIGTRNGTRQNLLSYQYTVGA